MDYITANWSRFRPWVVVWTYLAMVGAMNGFGWLSLKVQTIHPGSFVSPMCQFKRCQLHQVFASVRTARNRGSSKFFIVAVVRTDLKIHTIAEQARRSRGFYQMDRDVAGVIMTAASENCSAVVDMQRPISESRAGKRAKADLMKQLGSVRETLESEAQRLRTIKDQLPKESVSSEQAPNLNADYARQLETFQSDYAKAKNGLQRADERATQPIIDGLTRAMETVRKRHGYDHICEKASAGNLSSAPDVTDEVIQEYDSTEKTDGDFFGVH
jgi:Skp family chaperone for outer membrane proteins